MERYNLDYGKIVENVKSLRKLKGMSQMELSERADLSLNTISRFEINQKQINLQTLIKIANALDVDVNYLLGHAPGEVGQQDSLISGLIVGLDKKDKELLISIITAIRTHRI
ncbi:MAG: helix-turn-helix transcriptional regulator [Clostridiales bacterium]|jgi:transcriptional regulator with XRE-family HTH domain|nr:helix-turn-helix transcriptional regulator [Clostridiales bacterium]